MGDIAVTKNWPGHQILDLPPEEWTPPVNKSWIQGGIDRPAPFYKATPEIHRFLWDSFENRATVYSDELKQIRQSGFKDTYDNYLLHGE